MFKYPWGNLQGLNLAWFLEKFNQLREDWATAEAGIEGALDDEIQKAEDALSDVFDARDAAAASATAAAGSAAQATTAANFAGNSASVAAASASAAQTAAANAAASETAAGNSANAAAGSATAAAGSATAAGNSAAAAQSSAAAAAASDAHVEEIIEDATSEAIASATETATTAATNAAGSASAAAGSASAAAASESAAAASASAAAASVENIPSFAYPIVDNGAVENAHPVSSLNITKRGAFYKITGTRGSLGPIINLAGTNFELLSAADYYPNAFNVCPDIANAELVVIVRGSAGSTLTGERIAIGLAEFTENPTNGDSTTNSLRRLGIQEESFDTIKAFPLEGVRGAKVRPFVYLRANGNYDVEICFYLSFNNSTSRSLQGLLPENEIDTKENINETEESQTEKQL